MNILTLLEKAKFSKEKMIAYHGTSGKYLHSILKKGLLKNYSPDGLGTGDYSDLGFTLDPHEGVYATSKPAKAVTFAKDIDSENPLIIVLQVQPKNINLDEDEIFSVLGFEDGKFQGDMDNLIRIEDEDEQFNKADEIADKYFKNSIKEMNDRLINKYDVPSQTANKVSDIATPIIKTMIDKLVDGFLESRDADIRNEQEKLLKLFKHVVRSSDEMDIFQIPSDVGFKGANKIIGIFSPKTKKGWGKTPSGYEKVENPKTII